MSFRKQYKLGQKGLNTGLYMGEGLHNLSQHISGVQRKSIYAVAASPKVGKTTFVDYAFLLEPYMYIMNMDNPPEVEWIYYSLEMDRVTKEFDFACYFLNKIHEIIEIKLPQNVTYKGEHFIPLSSRLLLGQLKDDKQDMIKVPKWLEDKLFQVHKTYIEPLVGIYDKNNLLIKSGLCTFVEQPTNPTGFNVDMMEHAELYGTINKSPKPFSRIISYTPNNRSKYTIVIYDHVRKTLLEKGYDLKRAVDKLSEYQVNLRNLLGYTFINVIHMNRNIANTETLKLFKDQLAPTPESIKSTGNISEDANYVIGMLSPNDDRYGLKSHFGLKIRNTDGSLIYPFYKTIHLMEGRSCEPANFRTNMNGALKVFAPFHD